MFAELAPGATVGPLVINGAAAGWIDAGEQLGGTAVSLVVEDGRIARIFAVRNPGKLTRLDRETPLAR